MAYYDDMYEFGYSSQDQDYEELPFDDIELTAEEMQALLDTEPPF